MMLSLSRHPFRLGALLALVVLILDQATKFSLLFLAELPMRRPIALTSFLDLTVVWNRGISYGLFQQGSDFGRWSLVALSLVAALALTVWMARASSSLIAASLGTIIGGAVGNAIDRIVHGAVFDFVHIHVGSFSWYVFNVADAAIVIGVIGLLYDSLHHTGHPKK